KHRTFLLSLMEEAGFRNYSKEWWHFWYTDELYPETYFDFPIEAMETTAEEIELSVAGS
ncbi:MAG: M15 family metallopeptidase, partial [Candidatus Nucleicultricaceae bacterium]